MLGQELLPPSLSSWLLGRAQLCYAINTSMTLWCLAPTETQQQRSQESVPWIMHQNKHYVFVTVIQSQLTVITRS